MKKSIIATVLAVGLFLALVGGGSLAAPGGPAQPSTTVSHGVTQTFTDVIPCAGDDIYTITITARVQAEHTTLRPPETGSGSFTQTGTFVAVPEDSGLPTYSGHFTEHFGGDNIHTEPGTSNGREAVTIMGSGSDGSSIHFHEGAHGVFSDEGEEGELISGFQKVFCK